MATPASLATSLMLALRTVMDAIASFLPKRRSLELLLQPDGKRNYTPNLRRYLRTLPQVPEAARVDPCRNRPSSANVLLTTSCRASVRLMRDTTTVAVAAAAAFFILSELSRMGAFDSIAVQAASLFRETTATARASAEECKPRRATTITVTQRTCERRAELGAND